MMNFITKYSHLVIIASMDEPSTIKEALTWMWYPYVRKFTLKGVGISTPKGAYLGYL